MLKFHTILFTLFLIGGIIFLLFLFHGKTIKERPIFKEFKITESNNKEFLEKQLEGKNLQSLILEAPYNKDILVVANSYSDGGGYNWSGPETSSSGTPEEINFKGQQILPKGNNGTYCSGFTFTVVMKIAKQKGLLNNKSISDIKKFQQEWYGKTFLSRETQCVLALKNLGIGDSVLFNNARPGDFVQFWRSNNSGHSVIFKDWIYSKDGEIVGLKYRSSQSSTQGIGDKEEYFSENGGRINKNRIYFSRINLPKIVYSIKKMVLIQGGIFLMGDLNSEFSDEQPVHTVTVGTFYMDETPVTYKDFQKYIDAGGARSKYWDYETYNQLENPVTGISWYHAIDYCNWRSAIEGFSEGGYRLPTEAEFEYAARGGLEEKKFPWGNEFDPSFANFDDEKGIMQGEWWRLAKVKDTPQNGYGLYGMSGNIWHWVNDWYESNYYSKSVENNPIGPETGRTKVLRGGSWGSISPDYLRVAKRSYTAPSNYNYDIGFRCILPVRGQIENIIENQISSTQKITYQFYQYQNPHYENPLQIDLYGEEFANRLTQFISDYYPNSIYFQTKIDEQEIINPKEITKLIIKTTKEYHIHPLFLTGVMVSESGFGCCSFPRWYNNPMAYHWQNRFMKNGLPTYEANSLKNRKYKDLESGFREFTKGIRREIYIKAAQKDLDTFHLLYVGYRADEWMNTISRVYGDVLGVSLDANFPASDVGKLIYTDWETINL